MRIVVLILAFLILHGCGEPGDFAKAEKFGSKMVAKDDSTSKVPILMYHYVRDMERHGDIIGWNLSINKEDFERQLKYLKENDYVSVHLADLIDGRVPEKAVVLTFDDGLSDFHTTALPLLERYGFTASNAVVTGMIGNEGHMTKEQILECLAAGMEITAHSVNHHNLARLSEAKLQEEILGSKKYLEENFGIKVEGFVYPSGKYSKNAVRVLEENGYKIAVTTEYGEADLAADKMLLLPRIRIDNRDGFNRFVKKLEILEKF